MIFFNKISTRISLALALTSLTGIAAPHIEDIINCFAGKNNMYAIKPFLGPVGLIEVNEEGTTYHYYGVHMQDQAQVDFLTLKRMITSRMGLEEQPVMQIVGDSGRFSPEGTAYGRTFVRKHSPGKFIIEYGYTGYKTGGQELDANSFLNEYIDEQPEQAARVLANVLGHTVWAINKWGCYVSPHVRHFVVVYNDAGMTQEPQFDADGKKVAGFTTFGDDVTMSDYTCDRLLCLEGGAQSFLQAINVLQQGRPVEVVYNLRKEADAKMFSAARLLQKVDAAFVDDKTPEKEQVKRIFEEYVHTLNAMFNAAKPDYKTKKALFDQAIDRFIDGQVYTRVHDLCTFHNAAQQ